MYALALDHYFRSRSDAATLRGLLALLTFLAVQAHAQSAYEPFDYPLGSNLSGQNGGSGFSEPWRVTQSGPNNVVTGQNSGTIVAGLSYSDAIGQVLLVSGGAWQNSSNLVFGQGQRDTLESFGADGSATWISFLVRATTVASGTHYACGTPGKGFTFGSQAVIVCLYRTLSPIATGGFLASFYGSDGVATTISADPTPTVLLVMKVEHAIDPGTNDLAKAWFNPILNQTLPAPDLTFSLRNYASIFSGATLLWGDSRSFIFDELRVGSDIGWDDDTLFVDGFE